MTNGNDDEMSIILLGYIFSTTTMILLHQLKKFSNFILQSGKMSNSFGNRFQGIVKTIIRLPFIFIIDFDDSDDLRLRSLSLKS